MEKLKNIGKTAMTVLRKAAKITLPSTSTIAM